MTHPTTRTNKRRRARSPVPAPPLSTQDDVQDALGQPCPTQPFELQEDGVIYTLATQSEVPAQYATGIPSPPRLVWRDESRGLLLYHGNCFELLDAVAAKYPEGRFDCIFADPPYFLSNGGITCHAGRMVRVDKGEWDKSRGPELNHEFNLEWLRRCQRVLRPDGTIWISGTHHVVFSIGYALQQLGYKILNSITWEKPNPPPNLSCRYFTHSTEIILWAAKNEKSKHCFNYAEMRKVTGRQMKTVWREAEFPLGPADMPEIWTMPAPGREEKNLGKHPTQKPLALLERCLRASTREGDWVLDPFLGSGTTAVACARLGLHFIGIDLDEDYLFLSRRRVMQVVKLLVRQILRVHFSVIIFRTNDLDLLGNSINGSIEMSEPAEIKPERVWQECKFVFLSCTRVSEASVVHTTVAANLQEAWLHAPLNKRRQTTHIVRCQTEIFQVEAKGQRD